MSGSGISYEVLLTAGAEQHPQVRAESGIVEIPVKPTR
jgi:hypothetical protein